MNWTPVDALLHALEPPLRPELLVAIEVNLYLSGQNDDVTLYVALRIGQERLYVIRNIFSFLRSVHQKETIPFGKGFVYDPSSMRFSVIDEKILSVLSEMEAAQYSMEASRSIRQNSKFMPLQEQTALRLLRLLRAKPYRLVDGKDIIACDPIQRVRIPIQCQLQEQKQGLVLSVSHPSGIRPITQGFEFVRLKHEIVQLSAAQGRMYRALFPHLKENNTPLQFPKEETERLVSELLPELEKACDVSLDESLTQRIRRMPLLTKTYIDRDGDRVAVRIAFHYGQTAINPFVSAQSTEPGDILLVRDTVGEHQVLEVLAHSGFHVGAGKCYLSDTRSILRFIQEGVKALQKVSEVYISERYKRMRPKRPSLSGKLTSVNGGLQLTIYDHDAPMDEILPLMHALRDGKRYFRLKNGQFFDLSGLSQWQELAEFVADGINEKAVAQEPSVPLQAYQSAYLISLLSEVNLPIDVDPKARRMEEAAIEENTGIEDLAHILRPYQTRGFQWIQTLYRMKMGGILADDMGLGKTLQVISSFAWSKEKEGVLPSLVVAPTSLIYNWQAEIQKFMPSLSTAVIEGSQPARAAQWDRIASEKNIDVVITSYPLLRRDIERMEKTIFRYIVMDEAQHIKNYQSLSAESAGRLTGHIRLALTGTPMENNASELWSIFHFVMPGYLLTLKQFLKRFGESEGLASLRRRIRPFLLRRLKADVLSELPDKIETVVLADMPTEQKNVYAAAVLSLRQRVEAVLENKGVSRGRIEVLSALMKLRQICCHPALVMEDYSGASGKMDALMEIINEAVGSGHRILLFSQFTSMLYILRRTLDDGGISSLYLDGKTPVAERMELVNRFNAGEGQIFLISLKAGGAGLNLPGADMVIHYDPWWNPAAEDQATDRAHRIGQKRVVQVIRLITKNSIEEQVAELSKRKRALFDAIVTAGEKLPSDLSKDEILQFFT